MDDVEVRGGAGILVVAGQIADASAIEAREGVAAEFDSALGRLVAALEASGGEASALQHIRIFVTDVEAYVAAREQIGESYGRHLGGHVPASTLVEVAGLLDGAQVQIEGLALRRPAARPALEHDGAGDAVIRLRLAPADARYAGEIAAGSKAMEIFADLETELALREGGDEGLCVAYDMVEFLAPLRTGDFVEGRARVIDRGRTSRRIAAELYKVLEVDERGIMRPAAAPVLAARASATIVVGRTVAREAS